MTFQMLFLLAVQIAQNFKFAEHVLLSIFSNMKNHLLEIATYAFVISYLYFVEYPWFTKYRVFPNEGYTGLSCKVLFCWSGIVVFGFLAFTASLGFVLCSLYGFSQQNCIQFKHFYIVQNPFLINFNHFCVVLKNQFTWIFPISVQIHLRNCKLILNKHFRTIYLQKIRIILSLKLILLSKSLFKWLFLGNLKLLRIYGILLMRPI